MKGNGVRFLIAAACGLIASGCATQPPLYQWGGYDELLYQSYKAPEKAAAMRLSLEAHVGQLEQSNQKVPPGLYAELGSLHLQTGDQAKAVAYYGKERDLWPESKGLMDAMIRSVERRQAARAEVKS